MSNHSFQPPPTSPALSESALQAWAEQVLQRSRTLQELPLILVAPALIDSKAEWQTIPVIQSAIQTWLQEARLDDERLRIERQFIPHTAIYIPDNPEGRQFFQLAKAIGGIPLHAPILPKNQNQGYWLKTLHYYWQARGVVIAQRLLGVIVDPLAADGILKQRLSDKNLEYLHLSSAIDVACFDLLTQGERYIKQWAKRKQKAYPFETPNDLFLKLLQEEFFTTWQLGPGNSEEQALAKAQQRDNIAVRVRLLKKSPWIPDTGNRPDYKSTEQEYLQYLQQAGWSGFWLLALREHHYKPQIEPHWNAYVLAISGGKELTVDILDWLDGEPLNRPMSNAHKSVEATLDSLGYIHWIWA